MKPPVDEALTIFKLKALIADLPDDQKIGVLMPKGLTYLGTVDVYCMNPYGMKAEVLVFRP